MGNVVNAWEYLGIPPNSDKRTIKLAYARRARECNPEDKPDEFMALRQAYETALEAISAPSQVDRSFSFAAPAASTTPRPSVEPEPQLEPQPISEAQPVQAERPAVDTREVQRLAEEIAALVQQAGGTSNLEAMEALLNNPLLEFPSIRDDIGHHVLNVLWQKISDASPRCCPLDRSVILTLDRTFGWSSDYRDVPGLPMDNIYLLLDAAHASEIESSKRLGWRWLGRLLANSRGRISRLEWLFAFLVLVLGTVATLNLIQGVMNALPRTPYHSEIFLGVALLATISFFCFTVKRSVDAGVSPIATLIFGFLFPVTLLFFIAGVPKEHARHEDPRIKFTDPLDMAFWDVRGDEKRYGVAQRFAVFFKKLSPRFLWSLGGYVLVGIGIIPILMP